MSARTRSSVTLSLALVALSACPGEPPGADDEAGTTSTSGTTTSGTDTTTGETGETSETDETSTETTSGSEGFVGVGEWDFEPAECDSFLQDCPDGEKCVPYASGGGVVWDAHKCVPITGDGAIGESCFLDSIESGIDDCGPDGYCFDGTCLAFCLGSFARPMCPEGSWCPLTGLVALCFPLCDPLIQDCGDNEGCYFTATDFACLATDALAGPGGPCEVLTDCEPGTQCVDGSFVPGCVDASCCASWCDVTTPDPCPGLLPGSVCTAFFEPGAAPEGSEDVGLCVSP